MRAIHSIDDKTIQIVQVGEREKNVDKIADQIGFRKDQIINTGFIDYKRGMSILKTLDALLIVDSRMHALGTKIYDYIYVNKPIIYVGPKGSEMGKLLSSFENAYCCSKELEVKDVLNKMIIQKPIVLGTKNEVEQFSREAQNKKYETLMRSISGVE